MLLRIRDVLAQPVLGELELVQLAKTRAEHAECARDSELEPVLA